MRRTDPYVYQWIIEGFNMPDNVFEGVKRDLHTVAQEAIKQMQFTLNPQNYWDLPLAVASSQMVNPLNLEGRVCCGLMVKVLQILSPRP